MQENLGEEISIQRLAAVAELSGCHFARMFKQSTGLSPHQYLLNCRIVRARQLLLNKTLSLGGIFSVQVDWLAGRASTVVLGLVYGYVPYMILPLYAALDRISPSVIEAARDLGAGRVDTFRRVILPMSRPGIAAGIILIGLPMFGDYFSNDLLSNSPQTAMLGNLINLSIGTPGQAGQAGALVVLLTLLLLVPMVLYVRSSNRGDVRS